MQFNRTDEPLVTPGLASQWGRFLSVATAAGLLGMSQVTLYRAIQAGEFPAIKVRGRYVIPSRAVDAMEDAALSSGAVVDAAAWAVVGGGVA
jgi:excisionase family DNA binding protein